MSSPPPPPSSSSPSSSPSSPSRQQYGPPRLPDPTDSAARRQQHPESYKAAAIITLHKYNMPLDEIGVELRVSTQTAREVVERAEAACRAYHGHGHDGQREPSLSELVATLED